MTLFTAPEWDVLLHALAYERDSDLLHERFIPADVLAALLDRQMLARPPGGSPFVMLTENGRAFAEARTGR